jgi:glycosyltransferase involved in cell wall biosynthesis
MFQNKKVSLVFPAYNEEENILQALADFKKLRIIDEYIVIDNNSSDKTAILARSKKANVVKEKKQGYGFALRKGLSVAQGDYIILAEPDGTFLATDTLKLLKKMKKYDAVLGTRTNQRFIEQGANMKGALRLGNIVLAKLIQFLYQTPSLSDCGCTFRVLKKSMIKTIFPKLTVGGSHFLSDLLVTSLLSGFTFTELPVHYRKRIGVSKITGSLRRSIQVGYQMFSLIVIKRFSSSAK